MEESYYRLYIENRVADGSISQLYLSPRAYNMLRLNGVYTISALTAIAPQALSGLAYATPPIVREITLCLSDYLHDPQNRMPEPVTSEQAAHEPGETAASSPSGKPVPIEKLGLSVRSYNCLKRVGLDTVQALIGKTEEELLKIRNLGGKSALEIVEVVKAYLAVPHEDEEPEEETEAEIETPPEAAEPAPGTFPDDRPIEVLRLSVRSYNALKRAEINTVQQLLDFKDDELSAIRNLGKKSLEELAAFRKHYAAPVPAEPKTDYTAEELKPLILAAFQEPFHGLSWQEFRDAMPETAKDDAIKQAIGALLAEGRLEYVDFRCYRVYPSFYEELKLYVNAGDDRNREIIARRYYSGETLESIAQALNLTRERVRQILEKQNRKLIAAYEARTGYPVFSEDFYESLYTRCELPDEFWSEELGLSESSVNYLKYTFPRGKKGPEEILRDEAIPVSLRYRVRSFLDRDKLRIDGKLFPRKRSELEDYAMEKYAQDEITFERFAELYNGMLEAEGIAFDEKIYYTEDIIRSRINHISNSRYCLWKKGGRLRWYDIDAQDYTALLETLNLGSYRDTDVSTLRFMHDYPEIMDTYDIRDAYELHNLLRKIKDRYALDTINFARQPILQFGEFDRAAAIKELMFTLSPVTQQELLEYLYLEYGYDKQTAIGYLTPLSAWCHNGVYSVDFKQIPQERIEALLEAMTEDFYYFDELRYLYKTLFIEADMEEVNPYSLKALGFVVNSTYAIQHYPSAEAYFTQLLMREDLYNIRPLMKRYGSIVMFTQTYEKLLKEHRLFLYEKDQVISFHRLSRLNVTEELLQDYCTAVKDFAEEESYFTVFSLRQDGFEHPLDNLGLSDYFYASLLSVDDRFSSCRMFGELVLYNGGQARQLSRQDFILTELREYDSVEPEDFMQDILGRFGLAIPDRYMVTGSVKDTELYYDPIMDKIYREKALFYADIDD